MRSGGLLVLLLIVTLGYSQSPSGITWNDKEYLALPLKATYGAAHPSLPARHSLKPYCPRVVNQTGLATSAVWASIWYGQSLAQAASCLESASVKITNNAFSPLFTYRSINTNSNCDTPISLVSVLNHLVTSGTPRFSEFNDLCPASIPAAIQSMADKNKIDGYIKLFNPFDTQPLKTQAIKKALHNNHPVVIGMITPPSLSLADQFWQPRERPDTTFAAQALCVVGYDDQKFGGAFEVVNQWGKSWGENGFTWIRYVDMAQFMRYGFELINSSKCIPLPKATVVLYGDDGKVIDQLAIANNKHQIKKPLKIGTRFRVTIRANSGMFTYFVIKERDATLLFPTNQVHPYITQSLTLPGNDSYYQLEGVPQINELYFITSPHQIDTMWLKDQIEDNLLFRKIDHPPTSAVAPAPEENLQVLLIELEQF